MFGNYMSIKLLPPPTRHSLDFTDSLVKLQCGTCKKICGIGNLINT